MEISAYKKASAVEQVSSQIISWIESGAYSVGQRLPSEAKIAEETSISRSSVREAIRLLSASGVLTVRHGSGTYVAQLPNRQVLCSNADNSVASVLDAVGCTIDEHMEFRISLEKAIMELIVANATDEDIDKLKSVNQQLEHASKNDADAQEQLELDLEFHRQLGKCTHNPLMAALYNEMMDFFSQKIHSMYDVGICNGYISFLAHQRIIDALYHRDLTVASSAVTDSVLTYLTLKNYKQP
ncbi:MAG: GntR family transcriptional regulator [Angelakisella sp.]|nr:GntR family transcriptional regulator [Angelakisella sp.]